jgi:hypothetical protein
MKRPGGVTAIAIWYLVTGAMALLSFCALVGAPAVGFMSDLFDEAGLFWLGSLGLCFGIFFLLDGVLSLAAGWGMLKLQEWGRLLGIFLAIFTLFAFPVGTVIGAVILWYLFQREAKAAFGSIMDADYTVQATAEDAPPIEDKEFVYYPPRDQEDVPPPSPEMPPHDPMMPPPSPEMPPHDPMMPPSNPEMPPPPEGSGGTDEGPMTG